VFSRSKCFLVGLLAIAACLAGPTSSLADLKFTSGQLPNGNRYILVAGEFGPDDDLTPFVTLANSHKPDFVTFDSPGGNVGTALKLGRMIRLLNLSTLQTRPFQCDSACAFAFVGGVHRSAAAGSIGVHQNSLRKDIARNPDRDSEDLQLIVGYLLSYLREMGVSSALLELALKTGPNDMRHLTISEMQKIGVVGALRQAERTPEPRPEPRPTPRAPDLLPRQPSRSPHDLHDCDRLAANAYDQRKARLATGVDYNTLLGQRKDAALQCERAAEEFPNELRFQYQLARAIELDDPKRAAAMYSNLINAKYLAAYDNLGWMYNTGRFGGRINKLAAIKLFREGAILGDPDSMHSLGVSLWEEDPKQAVEWFQRAVKLDHLEAKKNLEKIEAELKQANQQEIFPLFRLFKQK